MVAARGDRVESLDLIRGIAVLGILAINIAGFAGPPAAVFTPDILAPASLADKYAFAATFVLFEGKMRGLFSLLFGASMVLFIDRSDAAGRHGELLQLRRLGWLLLFGALHYYLLWWGDILFTYAAIGVIVLMMSEMRARARVIVAITVFVLWHVGGMIESLPDLRIDEAVRTGTATPAELHDQRVWVDQVMDQARGDLDRYRLSPAGQFAARLASDPLRPFIAAFEALGETLPLMLLGTALYRSGFFGGQWPRPRMWLVAAGCSAAGLALTLALLVWVWPRDFPVRSMLPILISWTGIPHLLMTLGYAALLVLAAPALSRTWPGRRIADAGRMAFSNYIGTTIMMTALFHGWGLGLAGHYGYAPLMAFVAAGWAAMLVFSAVWLRFYRRGPLEWLWRSLTEATWLPNRK